MTSSKKRELNCTSSTTNSDRGDKKQKKTNDFAEINNVMDDACRKLDKLKHSDPVLKLLLDEAAMTTSPDISFTSGCDSQGSFLSKLIHPLPLSCFLSSCFRQKALCIRSNNHTDEETMYIPRRIRDICENYMFGLDVEQILSETISENVFLWLRNDMSRDPNKQHNECKNNRDTSGSKALKSVEIPDPQTAYLLHKTSHHATYCRAPPELEQPLVSYMLRDTGVGCGQYDPSFARNTTMGRGEVEVFVGTEGHLTDWHFDFQENFTVQLSGSKKWTLRQGSIRNPIRGMTPHYHTPKDVIENQLKAARLSNPDIQFERKQANGFGHEVEVILRAGDVLYFPAGMWHKVETLEYGVSINISLMGMNYANLISSALEHVLMKRDDWRETVCSSSPMSSLNNNIRNAVTTGKDQNLDINRKHESLGNSTTSCFVTQKMEVLLKNLPQIVQEFCNNCDADCLIPPVLRHPPSFEILSGISSEKEDQQIDVRKNNSNGSDDILDADLDHDKIGDGEVECGASAESATSQEIDMIDKDDDEADTIIDVHSFKGPGGWTSRRISLQYQLVKNPLATLTKMEDVTNSSVNGNDNGFMCILNVCFAGDESMESAVRVILQDWPDRGLLRKCCDMESNGGVVTDVFTNCQECIPPALFYYGYLSWIKR